MEGRKIADAIIEESDRGYDLLILSSAGLSGVERTLFGSVSYEVAGYANIPVLIVKRPKEEIKRILTCTDSPKSAKAGCFMGSLIGKAVDAEANMLSAAPEFFDRRMLKRVI